MKQIVEANQNSKFLSDVVDNLPSKCLFNKGITGCGGTTLEIESKRDSIILVPNINLVLNKTFVYPNLIGVWGETTQTEFKSKLDKYSFNKIIATYDALPKLIKWIGNTIYDYFLLIDEYHILFNSYSFRYDAISFILQNFSLFKDYCFMTATPLQDYNILEELKNLPQIEITWPNSIPVHVQVINTRFTCKEVIDQINECAKQDYNLHIFINSLNTIRSIINRISNVEFRTICSKDAEHKDKSEGKLKVKSINSPICKVNFYTATAFEGVDIYDPKGKTVVISDTNISQSLVDISTLFIQICGRLRDSIYKDQVLFICNTNNHRYLKYKTDDEFDKDSLEIERKARIFESDFIIMKPESQETTLKSWDANPVFYQGNYLGKTTDKIIYDANFKKIDKQNYNVISNVFSSTVNVLNNLNATKKITTSIPNLNLYKELFELIPLIQVSYDDLLFECRQFFSSHDLRSNKAINDFLSPICDKQRREINGRRVTICDFTKLKTIISYNKEGNRD